MKRILVLPLSFIFTVLFCSSAPALERMYVSAQSGVLTLDNGTFDDLTDEPDLGKSEVRFASGSNRFAVLGYSFPNGRLEMEAGYRLNDVDSVGLTAVSGVKYTALSFMFNAYYDMERESFYTPYIGAGIGGAHITLDDAGVKADDDVLAYQAIAGIAVHVTRSIALDLQYRFFYTMEAELNTGIHKYSGFFKAHNFSLGVRIYI
ncbi:MAG: porin family protein [Deltaproteobacteria bacterium]|nr:porin family protein [Deltaproteobacteria bacterium]